MDSVREIHFCWTVSKEPAACCTPIRYSPLTEASKQHDTSTTYHRHTFKIENVRDAKGLEKELKGNDVSLCFFHDLIADEAIEKGKASKVMHDVVFELNTRGRADCTTMIRLLLCKMKTNFL